MKNEIRAIDFDTAEFRFGDHDKRTLEGYASVFGVPTDLGRFSETIQQGAFSRALSENQDVRAKKEKAKTRKAILDEERRIKRNKKQKEWYKWRKRAKAVGVPLLPAHRPIRGERQEWEYKIIEEEMETIL